jgi:hypothetical protein
MKHAHYNQIKQWIEDVDGQVILGRFGDTWQIVTALWSDNLEYLVIPRKHLDVALEYLNSDGGIEITIIDRANVEGYGDSLCWHVDNDYYISKRD